MHKFLFFSVFMAVGAAAMNPGFAAPTDTTAGYYLNYNCDELLKRAQQIAAQARQNSTHVSSKLTGDRLSSVEPSVVIPSALDGGSQPSSKKLAVLKERLQAVEDASVQRQCPFEFVSPSEK